MLTVTVTDAAGAVTPDLAHPSFAQQTGAANPAQTVQLSDVIARILSTVAKTDRANLRPEAEP